MSTFHGMCIGPEGAKLRHSDCPHTWANWHGTKVHTCECECHD